MIDKVHYKQIKDLEEIDIKNGVPLRREDVTSLLRKKFKLPSTYIYIYDKFININTSYQFNIKYMLIFIRKVKRNEHIRFVKRTNKIYY